MKNQIINEIQRKMLPYLNNEQLLHLKAVLEASFQGVIIEMGEEQPKVDEQDSVVAFITAKRIEGCSEKTLAYYSKTIEAMLNGVGKITAANYNGRFAKVFDGLSAHSGTQAKLRLTISGVFFPVSSRGWKMKILL